MKEKERKRVEKGMHSRSLNRIAVVRWLNERTRKRRLNQLTLEDDRTCPMMVQGGRHR